MMMCRYRGPMICRCCGLCLPCEPDDDISWYVLADPEGNEFCAFTR
jgi:hypothetical protein